jgi:hypothetical protein
MAKQWLLTNAGKGREEPEQEKELWDIDDITREQIPEAKNMEIGRKIEVGTDSYLIRIS